MQLKTIVFGLRKNKTMALRLQSSVHGRIRRLLMVDETGLDTFERASFLEILLQVFKKKPKHTQLIVWSRTRDESNTLELWFKERIQSIVVLNETSDIDPSKLLLISPEAGRHVGTFSRWVRDPFLVFEDGSSAQYLLGTTHNGDYPILDELKTVGLFREVSYSGDIVFAGGDIFEIEGYYLVGQTTIKETEFHLFGERNLPDSIKREHVLRLISENLYCDINKIVPVALPVKESNVLFNKNNWFCSNKNSLKKQNALMAIDDDLIHIDIFITPTGEQLNSKPLILLATLLDVNTNYGKRIDELNGKLNTIKAQLQSAFEIVRNEIPCVSLNNGSWTFLFYNNCLVERSGGEKIVWLPDYLASFDAKEPVFGQLRAIQKKNQDFWTKYHFQIVSISADFIPFLTEKGGLHCLTKELVRDFIN